MTRFIFTAVAGLFFSAISAQKAQKEFPVKIEGTISNFDGKYLYLQHKWKDKDYTDSTKVAGGKFAFRLKAAQPNLYWFTYSHDINSQPNCFFFVDEAPVKAALKSDSLAYSFVQGGQAQKDYLEYRGVVNSFVMIQMRMQNDFNDAVQKNDVNTQNAIRNEYQNLNTQYLNGLKTFIKNHPASPVSAYITYSDLGNPAIPIQESIDALSFMDGKKLGDYQYYQLVSKRVQQSQGTTVGFPANDFSQNTPEGKKVSLSDFRGKYVLLDFWASWCRPCRMENPNVVAAYNRFKEKGFTVLGVSMDTDVYKWVAAIQQDNLTWTHVSDLKGWANEVGKLYGVTGIPQNYLIDPTGKIVAKDLRGQALDEKLAEFLK